MTEIGADDMAGLPKPFDSATAFSDNVGSAMAAIDTAVEVAAPEPAPADPAAAISTAPMDVGDSESNTWEDELLAVVTDIRKSSSNKTVAIHGWTVMWTTRGKHASTRGDLCILDPEGKKFFSVVSLKRRLGLAPAVEYAAEPEPSAARVAKRPLLEEAPAVLERSARSTRTAINYAELTAVTQSRPELILQALGVEGGLDYTTICAKLHELSEVREPVIPYAAVRTSMLSMLRSGTLRRRLADAALVPAATPTEKALGMLVLSTLQVDEPDDDAQAPWRLARLDEPEGVQLDTGADGGMDEGPKATAAADEAAEVALASSEAATESKAEDGVWTGIRLVVRGMRPPPESGELAMADAGTLDESPSDDDYEEEDDDDDEYVDDEEDEDYDEDRPVRKGLYGRPRSGAAPKKGGARRGSRHASGSSSSATAGAGDATGARLMLPAVHHALRGCRCHVRVSPCHRPPTASASSLDVA